MRAHARVEDHIRRLKVSGLERFPFCDLDANRAWMAVVCFGADLVRWFHLLCVSGPLTSAEPKALRWSLSHTPARIVRHAPRQIVRILDGWLAAEELLAAYGRHSSPEAPSCRAVGAQLIPTLPRFRGLGPIAPPTGSPAPFAMESPAPNHGATASKELFRANGASGNDRG